MDMHDGWGWWMVFGWIWMVVFWGIVILAVVMLINHLSGGRSGRQDSSDAATRILEERFARGEIDREQLEDMRKALGKPT